MSIYFLKRIKKCSSLSNVLENDGKLHYILYSKNRNTCNRLTFQRRIVVHKCKVWK